MDRTNAGVIGCISADDGTGLPHNLRKKCDAPAPV